mgnify:CR=1 FL=1
MVVSKICGWESRSISSVGVTLNVDDSILHVIFFFKFFIVRFISIGKLVRIKIISNSNVIRAVSDWLVSVLSWNLDVGTIHNVVLSPEWLKVTRCSVWGSIVSGLLVGIGTNIVVPVILRTDLSDISVSLELIDESIVINDIIIWVILILKFFIVRSVSVGDLVGVDISVSQLLLSHLQLMLSLKELDFLHVLNLSKAELWLLSG